MAVDPYTRCHIIAMNGIEVESIMFSHQFNRHTDVPEVRRSSPRCAASNSSSRRRSTG
jgi:hypothetical protein